ncbi:MAG: hypothetical protein K9M57_01080 [Phycisphaerae bacterium]|nr:hypothetical protein [Phycisphaerae bacterium]
MAPGDSAGTLRFNYEADTDDAAIGYLTEDYRSNYDRQDHNGTRAHYGY